ncbi:MAG: hypothetical protein IT321_21695 [Anaerolineae bacterium]|nr:hypothetical protein [Anaerolineae bacterium]
MPPKPKFQTEAEWEEKVLSETQRGVIDDDGNLNFDLLRLTSITITLAELFTDEDIC